MGGSSSNKTTETTNNNYQLEDQSYNRNGTINYLDGGAISASKNIAEDAIYNNRKTTELSLGTVGGVVTGASDLIDATVSKTLNTTSDLVNDAINAGNEVAYQGLRASQDAINSANKALEDASRAMASQSSSAFSFGSDAINKAINSNADTINSSLNFGTDTILGALSFGKDAMLLSADSQQLAEDATYSALDFAYNATKSPEQIDSDNVKYYLIGAGLIAAAMVLKK